MKGRIKWNLFAATFLMLAILYTVNITAVQADDSQTGSEVPQKKKSNVGVTLLEFEPLN